MKTIIAGSRRATKFDVVNALAACPFTNEITEVVSGTAHGADKYGEEWAAANNIPVKQFPADWGRFGHGAGVLRNFEMARYAEALIAVWDGESKGTLNMIRRAKEKKLRVFIWKFLD